MANPAKTARDIAPSAQTSKYFRAMCSKQYKSYIKVLSFMQL